MSKEPSANIAASIRQRLLNLANARQEEFQFLLTRYGLERLLYRLGQSSHKDQFILKGAMLFQLWTGQPHRSTLDLDLLGMGDGATSRYEAIFKELCILPVQEDGLRFLPDKIHAEVIREDQKYAGVRIHGLAMLGSARISLQVDVGLWDAVTPKPRETLYPSLLNLPAPTLWVYPKETVVSEKFEIMISLGIANSRMKDFYDLWILVGLFEFEGALLARAIKATFERRGTPLPVQMPLALTTEFSGNPAKQTQWQAFIRRGKLAKVTPPFGEVVRVLADFLWPVAQTISNGTRFNQNWPVNGPWR